MKKNNVNANVILQIIIITGIFSLLFSTQLLEAGTKRIKGIVFHDLNENGKHDKGEPGVQDVSVSNQQEVVKTDNLGRFQLPLPEPSIIFISKPAGFQIPLDKNNIPRFYYIHNPKGSPAGLKYPGISPTDKHPRTLYFPLIKEKESDTFDVLVMGDPQTRTLRELSFYRDDVVAKLMESKASFYLALGDILYDQLDIYDQMNDIIGQMGIPAYHVMGNHDRNQRALDSRFESETYKRVYGPDYYSFNYGKVHFVVLNTIKHNGWNIQENKSNGYIGHIHDNQLKWIKNDLSYVPEDYLVVLAMHIPIYTPGENANPSVIVDNRDQLFKILESRKHLLALTGHMHYIEYLEFNTGHGWKGSAIFPQIIAGAGCGTWWHGIKDTRGVPFGIGTDGAPNGYFRFTFDGNNFHYKFHATRTLDHPQMRINSPFGSIKKSDLAQQQINVNVFAGFNGTLVKYKLDDRTAISMKQTTMGDPLIAQLLKTHPEEYLDWMEPIPTEHIWTASLPDNLNSGVHRLKIMVRDHQGNVFEAYRLFEVIE